MENNPLRGLSGVSSPRPGLQLATPQPTAPTENIEYDIPSGMIEQLLANPYAGDGTEHPDMHLIHVEQICGGFKLAGLPRRDAPDSTVHQSYTQMCTIKIRDSREDITTQL